MRMRGNVRLGRRLLLISTVMAVSSMCGGGNHAEAPGPDGATATDQNGTAQNGAAPNDVVPRDDETPEVAWTDVVDVAAGDGYVGPWRMNESDFHYVDDPSVALREDGVAGVVWADNRRQDILFQRYTPDGEPQPRSPVNVSRSPDTFSWLPRVVMRSEGQVFVLWQEIVFSGGSHGGEIFFARSHDGGRSFSRPINLSNTPAGAGKGRLTSAHWDNGSLDLVQAPDGTLVAAWTEYEGALRVSRSTDDGNSFSEPVHVNAPNQVGDPDADGPLPARAPALAVGPDATLYLAWTVGEKQTADIRLATSQDGGASFAAPRRVTETGGHSDAAKIAIDAEGNVHVVHIERPGGPFEIPHVQYTRRLAGEEDFELPQGIAGPPAVDEAPASFPSLSLDDAGHVYVIWEQHPEQGAPARGLGITVSRDSGRTFAPPSMIPGSDDRTLGVNGGRQGRLMRKLAVNAAGDIAVVHSHFRENQHSHVRLIRGQLNPAP